MSKIAKIGLIDVSLAYSLGKSYGFGGFRSEAEVFQAKIRPQHAVWMPSAEVDALFRLSPTARMQLCLHLKNLCHNIR